MRVERSEAEKKEQRKKYFKTHGHRPADVLVEVHAGVNVGRPHHILAVVNVRQDLAQVVQLAGYRRMSGGLEEIVQWPRMQHDKDR